MQEANHSNQSVGKVLKIIEALSQAGGPMRLLDIAEAVRMPSSTALRMLAALKEHGYVQQEPETAKYFLTLKFAYIGSLVSARLSLRDIAHPHLVKLSERCGEASCMAVESTMQAPYVDVVDGPDGILKIMQHIGKQAPLHCTGVGKCILLNYDEKMLDQLIEEQGLPSFTPNTITTKKQLMDDLERIRSRGYAMDDEECELGARCIASGVRDYTGKVVASVSVSGPLNRMTPEQVQVMREYVMEAAGEVSKLLLYGQEN